MFSYDKIPYFPVRPVNDRIAYPFCLEPAGLEKAAAVVVIIVQDDFFGWVARHCFINTPTVFSSHRLFPSDPCCDKPPCAASFFQDRAAIADNPRRRHELFGDQAPHCHAPAFVEREIDRSFDALLL